MMTCIDHAEECIFWHAYGGLDFPSFTAGGMIQETYGQHIADEGGVDDGAGVPCKDPASRTAPLSGLICRETLKKQKHHGKRTGCM